MGFFMKKPIVVEATQFDGENFAEMMQFCGFHKDSSGQHEMNTFNPLGTYLSNFEGVTNCGELWVAANGAWLRVVPGEWVIRDSLGFYPCQEEKFQETYDDAELV